jgi:hypothetical protein
MICVQELVYWRLWQCRKVFICIAAFVYLWCACKYRDLNLINNQMLAQIQKQNEEIQRMLQGKFSCLNVFELYRDALQYLHI